MFIPFGISNNTILLIYLKKIIREACRDVCTQTFTMKVFSMMDCSKQANYPKTGVPVSKLWYIM